MSRMEREALDAVRNMIAARQLGEAFAGLDDRRHTTTVARGRDRRHEVTGAKTP